MAATARLSAGIIAGNGKPVRSEPSQCCPTMNKPTETMVIDDHALLNEVDDMVRKKMAEREKSGADREELLQLAEEFGRMLDLLDARISGMHSGESESFKRHAFGVLEEGFYEKIEVLYDPDRQITSDIAETMIAQTRQKIQRLEQVLFSPEPPGAAPG